MYDIISYIKRRLVKITIYNILYNRYNYNRNEKIRTDLLYFKFLMF